MFKVSRKMLVIFYGTYISYTLAVFGLGFGIGWWLL